MHLRLVAVMIQNCNHYLAAVPSNVLAQPIEQIVEALFQRLLEFLKKHHFGMHSQWYHEPVSFIDTLCDKFHCYYKNTLPVICRTI